MTPQEVKLWLQLRQMRESGFHFRRQVPRLGHILDFACLKKRVAIELDGGGHARHGQALRDRERDRELVTDGFIVLRFWNGDIDGNLSGVIDAILEAARGQADR
jgi:very-short-patch-repair endonuclease